MPNVVRHPRLQARIPRAARNDKAFPPAPLASVARRGAEVRLSANLATVVAASCLVAAGLVHAVASPEHWQHAPAHGIFHVLTAIGGIAGGLALLRRPVPGLRRAGAIVAGGLMTLLVITRMLPAPFHFGPEEWDQLAILALIFQATTFASLLSTLVSEQPERAKATVAAITAAAVVSGGLTYVAGEAAEPWLPQLWARTPSILEIRDRADRVSGPAAARSGSARQVANDHLEVVVGGIARPLPPDEEVAVRDDITAKIAVQPGNRGARTLDLLLLGGGETPVDGARIVVVGSMRFMEHGNVRAAAMAAGAGKYLVPIQFSMPGDWQLAVQISSDEGPSTLNLDLDVE